MFMVKYSHLNFFKLENDYVLLFKRVLNKLTKRLFLAFYNSGGRNCLGMITSRHRGKTNLAKYLFYDRVRSFFVLVPGLILHSQHFVYKNKQFNFICYDNGFFSVLACIEGLRSGDISINGLCIPILWPGNLTILAHLPTGVNIVNVVFQNSQVKCFGTATGTSIKLLQQLERYSLVKLPSGEKRLVDSSQSVCLGQNMPFLPTTIFRKAGILRKIGRRPTVRGVAMNPVDHPHGGGQGKTSGGQPSVSPWGIYTKGKRTRRYLSRLRIFSKGNLKSYIQN